MEDTSDLTADRVVRMTRRDLLLRVSLAGAGLTGLATLAACGPQTPPAAPTAAAPTAPPTQAAPAVKTSAPAPTVASTAAAAAAPKPQGGQAIAPAGAKKGGTLVVANEADMNEGDPQKYSGTHAGRTLRNLFDPLVTVYDDSSDLKGGLAESWEISPDATQFTFHLRKGILWPEGQPFTYAELVIRARNQATTGLEAFYVDGWSDLEAVATGLEQTARLLPKSTEVPLSVKDRLGSETDQLQKDAKKLGEAARAKNAKEVNEILQRIKESNGGPLDDEGLQRLFERVIDECRKIGVPVRVLSREELDEIAGNAAHQGLVAATSAKQYSDLDDIVASRRGEHRPSALHR